MSDKALERSIGNGLQFPIVLENNTSGLLRPTILYGDIALVQQNLKAILVYEIGQRIRQEYFGSSLWSTIEEPNNDILALKIANSLNGSVKLFEPRVNINNVQLRRLSNESVAVNLFYSIAYLADEQNLQFQINS